MDWGEVTRQHLEKALNESDVVGVRLHPSRAYVDVLLEVLSLPPIGPLAKDGRRILRLWAPSDMRFLLRADRSGERPEERHAIPLADLDAVEQFFDSLAWGGSIYGWRFFDDPDFTSDWPESPSLTVELGGDPAPHTFYWFNECGTRNGGLATPYFIEGTVAFHDLTVLDASGRDIPIETFIADGMRQWDAFYLHDERMSSEAQLEALSASPAWRKWARGATWTP